MEKNQAKISFKNNLKLLSLLYLAWKISRTFEIAIIHLGSSREEKVIIFISAFSSSSIELNNANSKKKKSRNDKKNQQK